MDNGLIKQVKEEYLIDAMSFTEAEARVLQEVGEGMREVVVDAIARSPINEVVMYGDTDLWCKCKVTYSLADEETEKEKKVTTYLLINANDTKEAYERCTEHLKEMLVPFEITKIEETKIIEIYEYEKQAPRGFKKVSSVETTGRTDRRAQQLVNAFGMAIGVRGVLVNRKGDEKPLSFAETATDAEWDGFLDGTEALIESKIGNGPAIVGKQPEFTGEFNAEGDDIDDSKQNLEFDASAWYDSLDGYQQQDLMNEFNTGDAEFWLRSHGLNHNQAKDVISWIEEGAEHIEECSFEEDYVDTDESVTREMMESSAFFPEEMKRGYRKPDPTDGQAIGMPLTRDEIYANAEFVSRRFAFWSLLNDAGYVALDSDLDEIQALFDLSVDEVGFCEALYAYTEGKITHPQDSEVWSFLEGKEVQGAD